MRIHGIHFFLAVRYNVLARKKEAYHTGCSQAVPHPSTIPARRCLTSVIRRERVCSSWYGRRQLVHGSNGTYSKSCIPDNRGDAEEGMYIRSTKSFRRNAEIVCVSHLVIIPLDHSFLCKQLTRLDMTIRFRVKMPSFPSGS